MDSYGRIFYIDHKNHTTTWKKPKENKLTGLDGNNATTILNTNDHSGRVKERQQLDRRYQCIRKSIARNANMFMVDEAIADEITPPTVTPDRQRQLLISVSQPFWALI